MRLQVELDAYGYPWLAPDERRARADPRALRHAILNSLLGTKGATSSAPRGQAGKFILVLFLVYSCSFLVL